MNEHSIFISYAHEDYASARRLYQDLKNAGWEPWLDKEDLMTGQPWKAVISQAISNSRYFIALLSSSSVTGRGVVNWEIASALEILDEYSDSDIFLLPVRLNECQPTHAKLKDLHWTDMFPSWDEGLSRILKSISRGQPATSLRSHPQTLSNDEVGEMIRELGFYDSSDNPMGHGIKHEYSLQNDKRIVFDKATGLFWKRTAYKPVTLERAQHYLEKLNQEKYCGFEDWRLPTLEEAMSLVERERYGETGYYLASIFQGAAWIWTADLIKTTDGTIGAWIVFYNRGVCMSCYISDSTYSVMAVRSERLTVKDS